MLSRNLKADWKRTMNQKSIIVSLFLVASTAMTHAGTLKDWFVEFTRANLGVETIVIAPGYKVLIAGKSVPVFGNQLCPRPDGTHVWFVGGEPDGGSGCIVVQKDTVTVLARIVVEGKMLVELWSVEHRGADQMLLRRPNGEYIAQAN